MQLRGGRRAGRRRGGLAAGSPPASAPPATAPSSSSRPTTRESAVDRATRRVRRRRRRGPASRLAGRRPSRRDRARTDDAARTSRMIRLGSLAGYPFEGPRVLGGLDPAGRSGGLRRSCTSPTPRRGPRRYAVIYVGHADDLSAERFPFNHPRAPCWIQRAGSRWKVLHLHLRGARRAAARTASRSPRSWSRSTTRAATSSSTTGPGGTSGSASTPTPRTRPPCRRAVGTGRDHREIRICALATADRRISPTISNRCSAGTAPVGTEYRPVLITVVVCTTRRPRSRLHSDNSAIRHRTESRHPRASAEAINTLMSSLLSPTACAKIARSVA